MGIMAQQRRKFTPEDRLSILQEGEREGHTKTFRKYQIAPSLYNRWRKKYLQEGIYGLKDRHKRIDPDLHALELENERLRRIIAKQALEIEVKSELFKKTPIAKKTRKVIRTHGKREWVKLRKVTATRPMEYLCCDIKYIWIKGECRNYYMLSPMDIYSRRILDHIFQGSIRKIDVIKLIARMNLVHGLKGVTLRNDNGSQFIAGKVRHYLRTLEANQEFTHIATPEENSYIEAFHSILEREVIQRFEFESYYEARLTLEAYVNHYNNSRLHGSLKRKTPMQVWNEYYGSLSTDKPQSAQVSEGLSGVSDCADTGLALDKSGDTANFAFQLMNESNKNIKQDILNSFEKSVQVIGG